MKTVIIFFSFLFLSAVGCQQGGGTQTNNAGETQTNGSKSNKDKDRSNRSGSKSIEELKQEVLDMAGACSSALKKQYEEQIELQAKRDSEEKLRKSLKNMKDKIKC